MSAAGPAGLEIASVRRRALASMIDLGVLLPPCTIAGVVGFKLYTAFGERDLCSYGQAMRSGRFQLALAAGSMPLEVALRNSRSPGARALGLWRVDARTGGPVSVERAVIRAAVQSALHELNQRVLRPFDQRTAARRNLIDAEVAEARRTHADDVEARRRAMLGVYKRHRMGPAVIWGRALLRVAPLYVPALWSPRNQTLPDRVAGLVVVRD
jgi:RDD family